MPTSFQKQALRAALNDLNGAVAPKLTDMGASATVGMLGRLLAHAAVRDQTPEPGSIDQELEALATEEAREDALLASAAPDAAAAGLTAESLTPYLRRQLQRPALSIGHVDASLGGYSKQTLIVRLRNADDLGNAIVLRRDQDGGPVEGRAADEYPILRLMHEQGVPVPEPLLADTAAPFGGSVIGMRCVAGQSAYDVTGATLGPNARNAALELARVLAGVHAIPVSQLTWLEGTTDRTVEQHVLQMVGTYEQQWRKHRVRPSPTLAAAFDYLRTHVPHHGPGPTIVHGDASLRNLLMDGARASALLDWELWHLGDPTEDLAYCRPEVEQAMPWSEFTVTYRNHGGMAFDESIGAYYGLFGAVRNAVFGESCIHGFERSPHPGSRMAFAAIYLARKLIPDIATRLAALNNGTGGAGA